MVKKVKLSELRFSDRLMELRHVDPFTVSRYRIAMRSGAKFPMPVVNAANMEIVSGNHTVTAMLAEFGEAYEVQVEAKAYKSEVEIIQDFTRHNVGHGRPLDGFTQRKIAIALAEAGQSLEDVAKLLNVPVAHLQRWGDRTVVVKGRDNTRVTMPLKGGVTVPSGTMSEKQYRKHADADIGMKLADLCDQVSERVENGWIDKEDAREVEALDRLREALRM